MSTESTKVSRRTFLQWSGLGLTAAPLAACAPAVAPEGAGEAAGGAPAAASKTVSYWLLGGATWENFYHDQIFPLFYEQHPDIQMETTIIGSWTDLYNKLVTSTAGGAPPELARQKDFFTPDFAVRGILQELDDYAATSSHITEYAYLPLARENAHWDGKMVAMPLHIFIHYLHMSDELFAGAGLTNDDGTVKIPDN
ncbi:MAG: extracellular solute-binding protein, partial [Caldilineaceae bacterium]|nr:extracellular solute-binding protein [Caldilineaceae bacterium]